MIRLKLNAANLSPAEIVAKVRSTSAARASQAKGSASESMVRAALVAAGYRMVERIATPCKLVRGRLVYSDRVSGDFRAIVGPGFSVLVECKARDVSLTWTAFEEHQRRALDEHAKLGGISVVGWVQRGRVRILDWAAIRAAGFGPGRSVMWDLNATTWRVR